MSSNNSVTTTVNDVQSQILSQYLSLTLGFGIFILGIIGNCLNILIFLTYGNYKKSACSQYMLAGSVFDLLFLVLGLSTRILSQGFNIDFTLTYRIWCKLRSSLLDIISFCSFTCLCLQSIDIFLVTSRSTIIRQKSNVKIARILLLGFVFLWSVHEIPSLIFQDLIFVNGKFICLQTNSMYVFYHTYISNLILSICVPILVIGYFTFRIYQNLRLVTPRERRFIPVFPRQMTRMALFQIVIVSLFQCPFVIATAYFLGTTNLVKSAEHQLQDKLTQTFFNVYVYGLYASSFYCYYAASKRFRLQVNDVVKQLIHIRRKNQVLPFSYNVHKSAIQQQTTHF